MWDVEQNRNGYIKLCIGEKVSENKTHSKFNPLTQKLIIIQPFNSHDWPRQNFSLQYKYNIK